MWVKTVAQALAYLVPVENIKMKMHTTILCVKIVERDNMYMLTN